jgi:hypothetical protein
MAPMDYAIVTGRQAMMKAIFPSAVNGDLLKLVHLSNGFKMIPESRPLEAGDTCRAEARVVVVVNGDSGKTGVSGGRHPTLGRSGEGSKRGGIYECIYELSAPTSESPGRYFGLGQGYRDAQVSCSEGGSIPRVAQRPQLRHHKSPPLSDASSQTANWKLDAISMFNFVCS